MIRYIIELDQNLFLRLNNMGSEEFDFIWLFFSNKITMILFILMFTLLLCYKYAQQKTIMICFFLLICVALTDLLHVQLFKNIFMRLRPCWNSEMLDNMRLLVDCGGQYGFISGHAANSAAISTFLLFSFKYIKSPMKYMLIIWTLCVSYSRIYLGKHYPLDVFCGVIFGGVMGFFIYQLYLLCNQNKYA